MHFITSSLIFHKFYSILNILSAIATAFQAKNSKKGRIQFRGGKNVVASSLNGQCATKVISKNIYVSGMEQKVIFSTCFQAKVT